MSESTAPLIKGSPRSATSAHIEANAVQDQRDEQKPFKCPSQLSAAAKEFVPGQSSSKMSADAPSWQPNASAAEFSPQFNYPMTGYFTGFVPAQVYQVPAPSYSRAGKQGVTSSPSLSAVVMSPVIRPQRGPSFKVRNSPRKASTPRSSGSPLLLAKGADVDSLPPLPAAAAVEEEVDPNAPLSWAQRLKLTTKKAAVAPAVSAPAKTTTAAPVAAPVAAAASAAAPAVTTAAVPVTTSPMVESGPDSQCRTDAQWTQAVPSPSPASPQMVTSPTEEQQEADIKSEAVIDVVEVSERIYSLEFLRGFRDYAPEGRLSEVRSVIPGHLFVAISVSKSAGGEEDNWRDGPRRLATSAPSWRSQTPAVVPLARAQNSWSVAQAEAKTKDAEADLVVERALRGLLNKLTKESFEKLSSQLFQEPCAIPLLRCLRHLDMLVKLLFEKATQQHHFIPMYAELCKRCLDWLENAEVLKEEGADWATEKNRKDGACGFFKVVLIEHCQTSFDGFVNVDEDSKPEQQEEKREQPDQPIEEKAKPSASLAEASAEERALRHRTKIWGNLKLVGRLIGQKIISSRIAITCMNALLSQGAQDTLIEALAIFLTEVGPVLDVEEWSCYARLSDIFSQIQVMSQKGQQPPCLSSRVRFALVNLLELRAKGWGLPGRQIKVELPRSGVSSKPQTNKVQSKEDEPVVRPLASLPSAPSFSALKKVAAAPWARKQADSEAAVTSPRKGSPRKTERESSRKLLAALKRGSDDAEEGLKSLWGMTEDKIAIGVDWLCFVAELKESERGSILEVFGRIMKDLGEKVAEKFAISESFHELKVDVPKLPDILNNEIIPALKGC